MTKLPVAILGGGLAGLSAAYHLEGDAALYEQQPTLGGLCRQVEAEGFRVDAVPHVFHFRHDATRRFIQQLVGNAIQPYLRHARVYSHGTFIRYPFQAHLFGLPADVVAACLSGRSADGRTTGPSPDTFERWILATFGKGIADEFMVPYNTKFWTLPPSELTCEWVNGLIPVPTREETVRGAMTADPTEYGYNVEFWYPRVGGMGTLLAALSAGVPSLHLGKRVVRLDTAARRLHFADGDVVEYEHLLSSIPLPELSAVLDPLPPEIARALEALRWTSIAVVHLGVKGPAPAPWHWAYVSEPDTVFYRVGIPSHYALDAAPLDHHLLSMEISYASWKPLDRQGLMPRTLRDLERLGLLRTPEDVVMRLPLELRYGYPIYDRQYQGATTLLRDYLLQQGIVLIGRFGSWRYLSVEETILDGQQAAARVRDLIGDGAILR